MDRLKLDNISGMIELVQRFEGCRLEPYICPAGVWTCGWGSTGPDVTPGDIWTQEYADYRMAKDALSFARKTRALCPGLEGAQLAAIADFAYNAGIGALKASTLRKRILAGDYEDVPYQLSRWVYGGGRRLRGLVRRRAAEAELFISGG